MTIIIPIILSNYQKTPVPFVLSNMWVVITSKLSNLLWEKYFWTQFIINTEILLIQSLLAMPVQYAWDCWISPVQTSNRWKCGLHHFTWHLLKPKHTSWSYKTKVHDSWNCQQINISFLNLNSEVGPVCFKWKKSSCMKVGIGMIEHFKISHTHAYVQQRLFNPVCPKNSGHSVQCNTESPSSQMDKKWLQNLSPWLCGEHTWHIIPSEPSYISHIDRTLKTCMKIHSSNKAFLDITPSFSKVYYSIIIH